MDKLNQLILGIRNVAQRDFQRAVHVFLEEETRDTAAGAAWYIANVSNRGWYCDNSQEYSATDWLIDRGVSTDDDLYQLVAEWDSFKCDAQEVKETQ